MFKQVFNLFLAINLSSWEMGRRSRTKGRELLWWNDIPGRRGLFPSAIPLVLRGEVLRKRDQSANRRIED